MPCEQVRPELVALLRAGGRDGRLEPVLRHLEGCEGCRVELESLRRTWALLGQLPEARPGPAIERRVMRLVRLAALKESVLSPRGWAPATRAALIGIALSIGLSLLIPYDSLVAACRELVQAAGADALPYFTAGLAYGAPLAAGAWLTRRQLRGRILIGAMEASVAFLVLLAPYVLVACRDFTPALALTFASGLAAGAVASTLTALWLAERGSLGLFRS